MLFKKSLTLDYLDIITEGEEYLQTCKLGHNL